jgi:hypothetical protein
MSKSSMRACSSAHLRRTDPGNPPGPKKPHFLVKAVSVNDLHATILALMGLDHEKLTYRFNGRNFRLTDVAGHVVKPIIA